MMPSDMMQSQLLKLLRMVKTYIHSPLSITHPVNKLSTFYVAGAIGGAEVGESSKKANTRKLQFHLRFYKLKSVSDTHLS